MSKELKDIKSIWRIKQEIFWRGRYLPILLGILLIILGIYAYSKSVEKAEQLSWDDYMEISDSFSEYIVIPEQSTFIGFQLSSKKYESLDFQIHYIFDQLDIPEIRRQAIAGNKVDVWIKKDLYEQALLQSRSSHINGDKTLNEGLFEVYMIRINNEFIFGFEDLVQLEKNKKWIGIVLAIYGLLLFIPPLVIKDSQQIFYYGMAGIFLFSLVVFGWCFLLKIV